MRKRKHQAGSSSLVSECEAFLNGTLAEYWEERGIAVPVWAWTNLLAHGAEPLIGECVTRQTPSRRWVRSWRVARSYLANEVIDLVDSQCTLADMQSGVLVPLELEMAARSDVSRWTPRQWVDAVDHAIRGQHSDVEQ